MRVAFVSDIHGNMQAWKAVRNDILAQNVDRLICLGDIVGYGPSPAEVLTDVYGCVHHFVLGNHDAVVAGVYQPDGFNQYARELIELSQDKLGENAVEFFGKVPLALHNSTFGCFHGHPAAPGKFAYVFDEEDARLAWDKSKHRLMFVGHTHRPALHQLAENNQYTRGVPHSDPIALRENGRYIINPGSVGMPRDKDFRASYLIYDAAEETVCWKRVAYDIDQFITDVKRTYEKKCLTEFLLKKVQAERQPPIREVIDFTPGESSVSDEVEEEREIEQIQAEATRWRWVAAGTAVTLLVAVVVFAAFWWNQPKPRNIAGKTMDSIQLSPLGEPIMRECMPEDDVPSGSAPNGWRARLGDSRTQSVVFSGGQVTLRSRNDRYPVQVTLPELALVAVERIEIALTGVRSDNFEGERPALILDYVMRDGTVRLSVDRSPLAVENGVKKRYTISDVPDDVVGLIVHLRGRFIGELCIQTMTVKAFPDDNKWLKAHGPVDINAASADVMQKIPGIGAKLALEIERVRDLSEGYEEVDDLLDVPGIGAKTLDEMREHLTVGAYQDKPAGPVMEMPEETFEP